MNKSELVDSIANETGLTKADSAKALEACLGCVRQSLKQKDEVRLIGFGTFSVSHRKATKGRNPRTGAEINIPARNVVRFKAGANLQEAVF